MPRIGLRGLRAEGHGGGGHTASSPRTELAVGEARTILSRSKQPRCCCCFCTAFPRPSGVLACRMAAPKVYTA